MSNEPQSQLVIELDPRNDNAKQLKMVFSVFLPANLSKSFPLKFTNIQSGKDCIDMNMIRRFDDEKNRVFLFKGIKFSAEEEKLVFRLKTSYRIILPTEAVLRVFDAGTDEVLWERE